MARTSDGSDVFKCSFCGKSQKQVEQLISGPGVYICEECIELCNEIIAEEVQAAQPASQEQAPSPAPREIFDFLEQFVIGREPAKRARARAVSNHYNAVRAPESEQPRGPAQNAAASLAEETDAEGDEVEVAKSNVMTVGPTGCGKTYLAQTLARMLDVPFAMA